jgi:hypothetical protein
VAADGQVWIDAPKSAAGELDGEEDAGLIDLAGEADARPGCDVGGMERDTGAS